MSPNESEINPQSPPARRAPSEKGEPGVSRRGFLGGLGGAAALGGLASAESAQAPAARTESVPGDRQEAMLEAYIKVLQTVLGELYVELLKEEGVNLKQGMSEDDALFFSEALTAAGAVGSYGSPFYLQLEGFDFVQASGLQITRSPGKNVVYLGFVLLMAGVFLMFYVPSRRLWFWIERDGGVSRVLMAGTGNRHQRDFEQEFRQLCEQLDEHWQAVDSI